MHALCIEGEGFNLGFGALHGDVLAVPGERNARGIADPRDDFMAGMNGSVGRSDESFLRDELAIRGD